AHRSSTVVLLQGTYTPSVHAHAGRTQTVSAWSTSLVQQAEAVFVFILKNGNAGTNKHDTTHRLDSRR
ncbi:MAG: hypothetical protein ABW158_21440, partial [Candidatus Thiodiazotropha sp. 6PDIVS]